MYNLSEHLENIGSNLRQAFQNGGNVMPKYRAVIELPGGKVRWLAGNTAQELAKQAFELGKEYPRDIQCPFFKEYVPRIFDKYKKLTIKPTTLAGYNSYFTGHMSPFFGDVRIDNIDAPMIQDYLNSKSDLSKKTLKEHLGFLIQIFDYAVGEEYIEKNPAINKIITIPSKKVTNRDSLEEYAIADIYNSLGDLSPEDAKMIALFMFTGMRRGELLGLKYKDIDDKFIHLAREAVYPSCNQAIIDESGKTAAALRPIPIIDLLRPFISDEVDPEFFVIGCGPAPLSLQRYRNTWTRIVNHINLYHATPHTFRHTFATICNNAELDPKSIKTIIGHSTTDITLGRYTHSLESQLLKAGELINAEFNCIFCRAQA